MWEYTSGGPSYSRERAELQEVGSANIFGVARERICGSSSREAGKVSKCSCFVIYLSGNTTKTDRSSGFYFSDGVSLATEWRMKAKVIVFILSRTVKDTVSSCGVHVLGTRVLPGVPSRIFIEVVYEHGQATT